MIARRLSNELSHRVLRFFIRRAFTCPRYFSRVTCFMVKILVIFFRGLRHLIRRFLIAKFFFSVRYVRVRAM